MFTTNLYLDLPVKALPLGLVADYGMISNGASTESLWNVALAFRIRKMFQLSFPLFMSNNLESSFSSANYMKRIRLSLNVNLQTYPPKLKSLNL